MTGKLSNRIVLFLVFFGLVNFSFAQNHYYNLKNEKINVTDFAEGIYILKNNKNCKKCFTELSEAITYLKRDTALKIFCLAHTDSSVFARKYGSVECMKLMPQLTNVFFDYGNANEKFGFSDDMNTQSYFFRYKVDITPAILLYKNGKIYYYSYAEIFKGGQINLELLKDIVR